MTTKKLIQELISQAKAAREARTQKALTEKYEPALELVNGLAGLYGIGQRSGDGRGLSGRRLLTSEPERTAFCCSEFARTAPHPWCVLGQKSDGTLVIGNGRPLFPDACGNVWEPFDPGEPKCVGRWKGPGAPIFPALLSAVGDTLTFGQLRPRLIKDADDECDAFRASGFYLDNDRIYDTAEDSDSFVYCVEHAEDGDDGDGNYLYPDKDGNVWLERHGDRLECVGRWRDAPMTATASEPPLAALRLDGRVQTGTRAREIRLPELVVLGSLLCGRVTRSRFYLEHVLPGEEIRSNDAGHAWFRIRGEGNDTTVVFPDIFGNLWCGAFGEDEPFYQCVGHWLPGDGEQGTATALGPPAAPRLDDCIGRVEEGHWMPENDEPAEPRCPVGEPGDRGVDGGFCDGRVVQGHVEPGIRCSGGRLPDLVVFGSSLGEEVKASEFYSSHAGPGGRLCETAQGHVMFADAATGSVCLPDILGNVWRLVDAPIYVCDGHWR